MKEFLPNIINLKNSVQIHYFNEEMIKDLSNCFAGEILHFSKSQKLDFHQNRVLELFASRLLILHLKKQSKINLEEILKIKFIKYTKIENDNNLYFSISHSRSNIFCASFPQKNCRGFGIDIEKIDRKLNPETKKLFINEKDIVEEQNSLLEIWSIKEACFKSYAQFRKPPITLKEIIINLKEKSYFIKNDESIKGTFELINIDQFIFSYAII